MNLISYVSGLLWCFKDRRLIKNIEQMIQKKFWKKNNSFIYSCRLDLDGLPNPDELAIEIIENIEAALNNFRMITIVVCK